MTTIFARLNNWLDERTGHKQMLHEALYENIPGGARWRYVSGSMLVFAFVTQVVTGLALWMCYSPASHTAWESVHYIQNEMQGGWLLHGIHHFMAQAMVVLLPIHLLQVVIDKAYKAPREINYWLGLILMLIVLGLGLTGYLLPWDQKGFWATKVATNLMSLAPGGEQLQKLVVGGRSYGHHTLTRFFALHAGVLPILLVIFLGMHVALFRRHGITTHPRPGQRDQFFWPHQVFKDAFACLVLLVIVLLATIRWDVVGMATGTLERDHLGAELSAPADPSELYSAARPEWYFLFLFQLLKKFKSEFVGAIVVPTLVVGYLFMLPIVGRWKWGHRLNVAVLLLLMLGAGYLTVEAWTSDHYAELYTYDPQRYSDPDEQAAYREKFEASEDYLAAVAKGHEDYERIRELARYQGIPRGGALELQRSDSETMGARLFKRNCSSCHPYVDPANLPEGIDLAKPETIPESWTAPNLYGFGTPDWFMRFLSAHPTDGISGPMVYGRTPFKETDNGMAAQVDELFGEMTPELEKQRGELIMMLVAETNLVSERSTIAAARDDGAVERGRTHLNDTFYCTSCHKFYDDGEDLGMAPDLTGYGSVQWLKEFIANPRSERFYGNYEAFKGHMPAFAPHGDPAQDQLSDKQLELLARWLRGDDRDLEANLAAPAPEGP